MKSFRGNDLMMNNTLYNAKFMKHNPLTKDVKNQK